MLVIATTGLIKAQNWRNPSAEGSAVHLRWLISHLDPILQNIDRELGGGVGGDPQPEVLRGAGGVYLLTHFVQYRHPAGRQVTVLRSHSHCHSAYDCNCNCHADTICPHWHSSWCTDQL